MKYIIRFSAVIILTALFCVPAHAHQFWINLDESKAHQPGHVMISLGYGHKLPMDDFLGSTKGVVELVSYSLYDPEHKPCNIPFKNPTIDDAKHVNSLSGAFIRTGDSFNRKIDFSADMKPGTWQIAAGQQWEFVTAYKNKKGRLFIKRKPLNEIEGAKTVLFSMAARMWAKAFFTVGKSWTKPKPVGHLIEIVPTVDMSNVKAGDVVSFQVLYNGKPLKRFYRGDVPHWPYFCAFGTNFGGGDEGYQISGSLNNGRGKFRIPSSGQWIVYSYLYLPINKKQMPELIGKAKYQYISGSICFNVSP